MLIALQRTSQDLLEIRETGKIPDEVSLRITLFRATAKLSECTKALKRARTTHISKEKIKTARELKNKAQSLLKDASVGWQEAQEKLSKAKKSERLAAKALKTLKT
jgi:hypothetical protein